MNAPPHSREGVGHGGLLFRDELLKVLVDGGVEGRGLVVGLGLSAAQEMLPRPHRPDGRQAPLTPFSLLTA